MWALLFVDAEKADYDLSSFEDDVQATCGRGCAKGMAWPDVERFLRETLGS